MSDNLIYAPVRQLAALIRARSLSARELLDVHLARIADVNPAVNAIVTLDEERARAEAAAADQALASDAPVGVLHGLPCAFKDTHATRGMRTTCGSPILRDNIPDMDEPVVARMRAAGVIGIGKTNVPEFAAGSHTFNPVFGLTRNPYDLSRSAGGSSGGAAAALAAGMVPVAEGSDLGGSLRNPASFCNVVGFRPTPGRVPGPTDVGCWDVMGATGPMGRTVDDVALLLSAIAGYDPSSPLSLDGPGEVFGAPLDRDIRGMRVAWSPDLGGAVPVDPAVADTVAHAAQVFTDLGCLVEQDCVEFADAERVFRTIRAWAFAAGAGDLLDTTPELLKPSLRWNIEVGRGLSAHDIAMADLAHGAIYRRTQRFFERYDVLLLPTSQVPPFDANLEYPTSVSGVEQTTYLDWMRSCYFVSTTGAPAISVPAGFTDGLPIGVQLVGAPRNDLLVLQVAYAFEQATQCGARRPEFGGTPALGPPTVSAPAGC